MLEIKNLYNKLESSIDCLTDYDDGYIGDVITKIADSQVDICFSDLTSWANGHFEEISETIDEFGWGGCGNDLYKAVQMAQFRENENEMYSELSEGIENFAISYLEYSLKMTEIPEENWEEIQDFLADIDNNNRLDEITDFLDEMFSKEDEE